MELGQEVKGQITSSCVLENIKSLIGKCREVRFLLSVLCEYYSISQFHNHAQYLKVKHSGGPLHNQTWQTEWKTAPLVNVRLWEYYSQIFEVFVVASCLSAKFDCPVVCQNLSLLATAYDCETGSKVSDFEGLVTLGLTCPGWGGSECSEKVQHKGAGPIQPHLTNNSTSSRVFPWILKPRGGNYYSIGGNLLNRRFLERQQGKTSGPGCIKR